MNTRTSFAQRAVLSAVACAAAALAMPAWAQVDPSQMVDAFENAGGKFQGFRRSGAKGLCAVGEFVGNAEGRALSVSSAFSGKPVPVVEGEFERMVETYIANLTKEFGGEV